MKREPFVLKEDCTFDYVVENKNDPQLGQFLNTIFEKIEDDNKSKLSGVFGVLDFNSSARLGDTKKRNQILKDLIDDFNKPKLNFRPSLIGADGIKILKTKTKVLPEFLYQYLQHNEVKLEVYKRHFSILKEKKVLFPKKENGEQQKIISIFSAIDEEIQLL